MRVPGEGGEASIGDFITVFFSRPFWAMSLAAWALVAVLNYGQVVPEIEKLTQSPAPTLPSLVCISLPNAGQIQPPPACGVGTDDPFRKGRAVSINMLPGSYCRPRTVDSATRRPLCRYLVRVLFKGPILR